MGSESWNSAPKATMEQYFLIVAAQETEITREFLVVSVSQHVNYQNSHF